MSGSPPPLARLLFGAFTFAGLLVAAGPAQNDLEKLEAKFNRETNPVKKAKEFGKLGKAEFDALRNAINSGNVQKAASLAERYRDQARAVHAALAATGINAENKPEGFKQLQISLRENIFKLRDLIPTLALEYREPFLSVQHELEAINRELLDALFPGPPNEHKKKGG